MKKSFFYSALLSLAAFAIQPVSAQNARLILNVDKATVQVSPRLYGLMTEEINHSYDGGLYGELIRNRIFKDNTEKPEGWSVVQRKGGDGEIRLIGAEPTRVPYNERRNAINDALTTCLQLKVKTAGDGVGIANTGYWGVPVRPHTSYNASFYAKSDTVGTLAVTIESNDGSIIYASGVVEMSKGGWKKYTTILTTGDNIEPTANARFVITTKQTGTYYFNLVSLFPPTYNNRPNGNRVDIMQMLADMKPTFLRFPGGNFLEGDFFATRFPWKSTLGPLEQRPGHQGCWGYYASDGMGLLEFLEWCEDLHMEPLLAVYAGYSLAGDHVDAGPLLVPYVQDALDEIEYVTGDVSTKWGAQRARDGHPKPFKLSYIEIGNEDWFDRSLSYDGRFNQFRKAINGKYPDLHCISTIEEFHKGKGVSSKPDMIDEHYYRNAWQMEEDADHYDHYDRKTSPKIFVGEWATREGAPTTNMNAALGDAAWMTGMERNSDIVLRASYAPLFVNVNKKTDEFPRAWQWDSDLIGYNALNSFGSPSYYAQKMFNNNIGSKVVPVLAENIPMKVATHQDSLDRRSLPKKSSIPALYYVSTLDTHKHLLFVKVVNVSGNEIPLQIVFNGKAKILPNAELTVLKSDHSEDTNTIDDPKKIFPVVKKISDLSKKYVQSIAPYSINILKIHLGQQ